MRTHRDPTLALYPALVGGGDSLVVALQAVSGLIMLYVGGDRLIHGASGLATRLGVSRLAIGLTVVAFGTSAPELVVSVSAALRGADDISVGNIVGSNIANISLILGVAALVRPLTVHAKIVKVDLPIMILASLSLVAVLANGEVSRIEGVLLLSGLAAYVGFTFWEARRESVEVQKEFAAVAPHAKARPWLSVVSVLIGLMLLVGGGQLLLAAATGLATLIGLSQAVVGLTIVAIGTSLPEAAASVIASVRGHGDIAIGNVVGSNIFNILGILGLTTILHPLAMGGITWVDVGMMVAAACGLPILLTTGFRLGRIEGGVLVIGFALYTGWLLI